jgi:uncharacterized integral membrane protein (TIGR00698 family)
MISVPRRLNEDWTAVIIGFVIIFLALLLLPHMPALPMFYGSKEKWASVDFFHGFFTGLNQVKLLYLFAFLTLIAFLGSLILRKTTWKFILSFWVIFSLAMLAQMIAAHTSVKSLTIETVFFSVLIGLLISNTVKTPDWLKPAIQSEFYIKIGLVLLGTSVLFSNIMKAGALGLIQALVVVTAIWYVAFWIARRYRIDDEMSTMLASAVSICGVSAAIATCGAIKGDNKKLSYVISLVLIVAIPMMILMPYLAKWMGLSQEVAGAWIGGTIDTTGAVVASGTIIGETAQKYAVIIKSAQNVLLGIAAFVISIYWTYSGKGNQTGEKPSARIIWERFPKFVLGFLLASLLFSVAIDNETFTKAGSVIKGYQNIWFSIAFVCIGLETKFADIFHFDNRKPLVAFLLAQMINILLTLGIAYLLFR